MLQSGIKHEALPGIEKLISLDGLWTVSVDAGDQPDLAQRKLAAPDWILKGGAELLDLGEVKHMAEVWINEQYLGARLWAPFKFPVGKNLRCGKNSIRVKIGNLLLNAVPQYENYKWKWQKPPTDEMLDAGLFGPVTIIA